ncbi:MAG TPA: carboxypeptidase-like regulatory domain-containing protein [Thermoanaerobaculia bacterium]
MTYRTRCGLFFAIAWGAVVSAQSAGPPAQADVPVRILVRSADDGPVEKAYVALLPPYRPWNRPLAESVTTAATASLHVPAGAYRLVAGAPGNGVAIRQVLIAADEKNELTVRLPALAAVTGTVRDAEGNPVPNATIADVNALVEAPLGRLSELAARQFGTTWKTESAADGTWSLPLPAGARNPIVATAPGYAVAWRSPKTAGDAAAAFVLQRGGKLRVTLDRADPELVVTLAHNASDSAVPAGWQAQLWGRRATTPLLEWDSLPAGQYDVFAQRLDPRSFSGATRLATVSVERGAQRELRVQLPAAKTPAATVRTLFLEQIAPDELAQLETYGRDTAGVPKRIAHALDQASGGTLLYLNADGARPPFFATTRDRFIAARADHADSYGHMPPMALAVDRGGASLFVHTADRTLELPPAGTATFHDCQTAKSVTVPVEIRKDGSMSFPAPATCKSFLLEVEPFGPLAFARSLPAGLPEWLGEFTLYASGRAAIRVVRENDTPVADAKVDVYAKTEAGKSTVVPVTTKQSQADGWTYFERLPAGRELIVVAENAQGDRSAGEPFRVQPAAEAIVDPLRIPTPATLIVEPKLDPLFVQQFPQSHIEMLVIDAVGSTSVEQRRAEPGEGGRVTFDRLQPGRWELTALLSTGTSMQPLRVQQVELSAGQSERIAPTIKPLVFRGRATWRGKGVRGNIDIRGSQRTDLLPSVPLSETGEFTAILPRRDTYYVDVRTREPDLIVWIGEVPFTEPAQSVEIVLPEGEVVATVRSGGRPAANVPVYARAQRDASNGVQPLQIFPVSTNARGEARLSGLLPGPWVVFAEAEDGKRYAEKSVTVSTSEAARVELEVAGAPSIEGRVLEAFGAPVPAAAVACILSGADGLPHVANATTADDGTFRISGQTNPRAAVLCSVTAASGVQGYRVVAGEPADLLLPASPAALQVLSLPPLNRLTSLWLIARDGRLVDVSRYVHSSGTAATLTLSAVAAEPWKLVRVSSLAEWHALATGAGAMLPSLRDITLKPGERARIDLKESDRTGAAE